MGKHLFKTNSLLGIGNTRRAKEIENEQGEKFALLISHFRTEAEKNAQLYEIAVLKKLNLLDSCGIRTSKAKLYIVTKLQTGKSLYNVLYDNQLESSEWGPSNNLSDLEKLVIAKQLCEKLKIIHEKGGIHQDIAPKNIQAKIDKNSIVVEYIDFGFSRIPHSGKEYFHGMLGGTWSYLAPECKEQGATMLRSDIYSLGILFRNDLQLPSAIYSDMIYRNFNLRASLDTIITRISDSILKEQSLAPVLAEMRI